MTNVRDFGAMGDGVNDDTEAIQHAVTEGGGDIVFPRGDYLIKRPIVIQLDKFGRTGIHGSGGTAKILMAGPGPAFRLLATHASTADPAGFRPEEWKNERMPTVRDIEIEGRHPVADGIEIDGVMQPTVTGVLIREVRTAIRITKRARNVIVQHCHLYHNTGIGVHLDRVNLHQTIIADNHISYCGRGGIRIEDSEIRNLQITGNDIEYNNARSHKGLDDDAPTGEIYVDVREGTVREGTICSNTIQATYSPNGANIRFIGAGGDLRRKAGMWTITGNLIGSQAYNIHLQSVRGVTVTGNHVYSAHKRNILVEDSRNVVLCGNCFGHNPDYGDKELCTGLEIRDSQDCVVSGSLIEDCAGGRNTVAGSPPAVRKGLVEIARSTRLNITGLQLVNPAPRGFDITECSDTLISSCTVLESRSESALEHAVHWQGAGQGNQLIGCRLGSKATLAPESNVQANGNLTDE